MQLSGKNVLTFDVIQNVQRHHDLIKAQNHEIEHFYQATRSNAVNMIGNWILKAEPGKLDIKICEPGIAFICLPIGFRFKLQFSFRFSVISASSSWPVKDTGFGIPKVYQVSVQ